MRCQNTKWWLSGFVSCFLFLSREEKSNAKCEQFYFGTFETCRICRQITHIFDKNTVRMASSSSPLSSTQRAQTVQCDTWAFFCTFSMFETQPKAKKNKQKSNKSAKREEHRKMPRTLSKQLPISGSKIYFIYFFLSAVYVCAKNWYLL